MSASSGRERTATRARRQLLLRLLHEGVTSVEELSARCEVSPSTVRRDLARMGEDGDVARTYGGAVVTSRFYERSIGDSAHHRMAAKRVVAGLVRSLVEPGGRIFLDAGTTCGALARLLAGDPRLGPLSIVTRGLETAVVLADAEHVELQLLGGHLRRLSHGLVGPATAMSLERMSFDVAFLGADAVDVARGVGEPTMEETVVKEQAAAVAGCTVVLADASKLDAPAPAWTRMPGAWLLATDADDAELAARARQHGVGLITPGTAAPHP